MPKLAKKAAPVKRAVKKPRAKLTPSTEVMPSVGPPTVKLTANLEGVDNVYYGETILRCLEQFSDAFRDVSLAKGKTNLHIEFGGSKSDQFLYPMHTKRLFLNRTYREIIAKRLTMKLI